MCSIQCWILSIWEALYWIFAFLAWFMHCQQGGEVWAWIGLLHAFRMFPSGFELILSSDSFPGGIVLTGEGHRTDRCSSRCWEILTTGLTGQSWANAAALFSSSGLRAFVPGELYWFKGSLHVCRAELFVFFELWFGSLRSFLEHSFVSDVSSRCPCLRGPKLVLFMWSFFLPLFGFRSLIGVSFYSFLFVFFSLKLLYVCVVKGEIEDHVWFEDRWMVASWCDEWLTTLCELILR
jgi:hypothetical protein